MNYYIQGDAANADKIKAAFEKLGYDTSRHLFNAKSVLYFTLNGEIRATTCNSTPAIIKTHPDYKELELPVEPKFKVGSWLYHNSNGVRPVLVTDYDERHGYQIQDESGRYHLSRNLTENEYRLWSIADAKDGEVLVCYSEVKGKTIEQAGIFKQYVGQHGGCSNTFLAHTGIDWDDNIIINGYMGSTNILPATKEQRELLFQKIKESGYEWDASKKELKKIPKHYDISNFHAGMPVLVRDDRQKEWCYALYSHYDSKESYQFVTAGDIPFIQCIPFNDETKPLLGTTDMCPEEYVNW